MVVLYRVVAPLIARRIAKADDKIDETAPMTGHSTSRSHLESFAEASSAHVQILRVRFYSLRERAVV